GAYLMAISIGFFIVFPLTYVFDMKLMEEVSLDKSFTQWCSSGRSGVSDVFSMLGHGTVCNNLQTIGMMLPQAVFLPALNLIITITFIRVLVTVFTYDYQLMEWA
ncbi:MAG: hypothetical protein AB1468_03410, partial [Candidatus Micrarchaeota archaeon]